MTLFNLCGSAAVVRRLSLRELRRRADGEASFTANRRAEPESGFDSCIRGDPIPAFVDAQSFLRLTASAVRSGIVGQRSPHVAVPDRYAKQMILEAACRNAARSGLPDRHPPYEYIGACEARDKDMSAASRLQKKLGMLIGRARLRLLQHVGIYDPRTPTALREGIAQKMFSVLSAASRLRDSFCEP